MDEFKNYKRFLVQISRNTMLLCHVYEHSPHIEDFFIDEPLYYVDFKESAAQLIKQLEGNGCDAFLIALRNECDNILEEHKKKYKKIT